MKVHISNFPKRLMCNLYTRYMNKKYGYVNWPSYGCNGLGPCKCQPFAELWREKLEDCVQGFYNIFNRIWFDNRVQSVKVRIDPWDTWSMDHTLAHIVLPMLKQLKETKHGAPQVDLEDVPKELRPSKKELAAYNKDGTTDENFFKRWDWILDEMIYAFDCKANKDEVYMRFDTNDKKAIEKEQQRITNGFRLFGKYYESLWD